MKEKVIILVPFIISGAAMAMPIKDLIPESQIYLTVDPESPIKYPEKKNDCPSFIYKSLAIIPDRKKIISPLGKVYRRINTDNQSTANFFGKNKFSSPLARIERQRKS